MKKLQALIVDDSEINQLILNKMLGSVGINATSVNSGKDAIKRIGEQRFDLIFMDIQMPDMDGYEATNLIRAVENGKDIPIIAVTANASAEYERQCLQAGMNHYLTKPVHISDIQQILDAIFPDPSDDKSEVDTPSNPIIEQFYDSIHGDLDFMKLICSRFEKSAQEILNAINDALADKNFKEIPILTHKMKGILSAFNADQMIQTNQELTKAAEERNLGDLKAKLERLTEQTHVLISMLKEFMEKKSNSGNYK